MITCLNRIRIPSSGTVLLNGQNIAGMSRNELARSVSYVAQKNEMSHSTVYDCILLGRRPYMKWGVSTEDLQLCDQVIAHIGLQEMALRRLEELSGGELQKVMLARALVQQPKVLLLDEPTSNLDPKNQVEMLSLIRSVAREQGVTVLIVIHDLNLALRYCDRFLFLKNGITYREGNIDIVTPETIEEVYGVKAEVLMIRDRKTVIIEG